MAASFTLPTVLANLTAGNQPLSLIDGDFTAVANPLLALGTYGNYYSDTGSANSYAITVSAPQTVALAAGLPVTVLASNTNNGASTLQINALAAKNIFCSGAALKGGEIISGVPFSVTYDGTQFHLSGSSGGSPIAWTPAITFATPGDLAVTYSNQTGRYIKNGREIIAWYNITTSSFTYTTSAGALEISGFPIAASSAISFNAALSEFAGITKVNFTSFALNLQTNTTAQVAGSGSGQGATFVTTADVPSGTTVLLAGTISYFA